MKTIEIKSSYLLQDKLIKSVEVAIPNFVAFVETAKRAAANITPARRYETLLQGERIVTQCTFIGDDGSRIRITPAELLNMPAPVAKQIVPALSSEDEAQGSVVIDGDGVSSPIIYKLGRPIKYSKDVVIEELEFIARTYGDLEDILAGDTSLYQTIDLINKIAKPVGTSLLTLPSQAVDQISIADGVMINNKVLPRFLE